MKKINKTEVENDKDTEKIDSDEEMSSSESSKSKIEPLDKIESDDENHEILNSNKKMTTKKTKKHSDKKKEKVDEEIIESGDEIREPNLDNSEVEEYPQEERTKENSEDLNNEGTELIDSDHENTKKENTLIVTDIELRESDIQNMTIEE